MLSILVCWPASVQALPLKFSPNAAKSRSAQDIRPRRETLATVFSHLTAIDINSRDSIDLTNSHSVKKNDYTLFISLLENKFTIQGFLFSSPYRDVINFDQALQPDFFGGMFHDTDTDLRSQQVYSRPPPAELGTNLIAVLVPMMILGAGLFGFIPLRLSFILLFIWFTSWVLLSSIVLKFIAIFTDTIGLLFKPNLE